MFAIAPIIATPSLAPTAPVGRQLAGEASPELQHSTFAPAEEPQAARQSVNQRDPDERRNAQIERERLTRTAPESSGKTPHQDEDVVEWRFSRAAADDASELSSFNKPSGSREVPADALRQIEAQSQYRSRLANGGADEDAVLNRAAAAQRPATDVQAMMTAARDAKKEERRERERQEITELVSERSIRLNQRLLEIALSTDELDVGELISRRV